MKIDSKEASRCTDRWRERVPDQKGAEVCEEEK